MSSPQNWRGTSKTIACRVRVGPATRGQALQLLKTVRNVLNRVRVVPVTNEVATQPSIEGPLITVTEIATLLRESNGRFDCWAEPTSERPNDDARE
jgi:hypothetical protein